MANGTEVTVIGIGRNLCSGWYVLFSAESSEIYWLPADHLAAAPPVAVPPVAAVPPVLGVPPARVIRTCIEGEFEGWDGESVFELCNGEVWAQVSYDYTYHYAYRPDVTIVETSSGWLMTVEGVRDTIMVEPVAFLRSCIDGNFEGWSGDTVFVLCNGQVWQQAEFGYRYRYAYRPKVLIYESPFGGFRLKVDGVSDTIRVKQLR